MSVRKHFIEIKKGESLEIDGTIVSLEHKSGGTARLVILADETVVIRNPEQIKRARRSAPLLPQGVSNGEHSV